MKKTNSIRQQLGVTQENLALLLKVSRSQLSMYELGKRDLPVEAKKQLAEMLQHAQKNSSKHTKSVTAEKKRIMLREKEIKRLLASNQYKTLLVERKIKALEKRIGKEEDVYLRADEALQYGLIDKVIRHLSEIEDT